MITDDIAITTINKNKCFISLLNFCTFHVVKVSLTVWNIDTMFMYVIIILLMDLIFLFCQRVPCVKHTDITGLYKQCRNNKLAVKKQQTYVASIWHLLSLGCNYFLYKYFLLCTYYMQATQISLSIGQTCHRFFFTCFIIFYSPRTNDIVFVNGTSNYVYQFYSSTNQSIN